jgi:hypothetical protein
LVKIVLFVAVVTLVYSLSSGSGGDPGFGGGALIEHNM